MNLILCGFQGVGKTTRGRSLARRVGASFYDTDEMLLQKRGGGITCAQIVAEEGVEVFRALECEVVASLEGITHSVIALGGGGLDLEENRKMVLNLGRLVYLALDYERVQKRSRIQFTSFEMLHRKRSMLFESLAARRVECDETCEEQLEKLWQEITLESSLRS